ncbi:MAG: hypothetical protein OHK0029_39230 [Armatimonadaceae bacterium]
MSHTLQEFLASAAVTAAADLKTALLRLPDDRRKWSAMENARTALDQVAECALMNEATIDLITTHVFDVAFNVDEYNRERHELMQDLDSLLARLEDSAVRVAAAIRTVPEEDLSVEIPMPWGPMTLTKIIAYPYWNMTYHEGQINYIASLAGCLE